MGDGTTVHTFTGLKNASVMLHTFNTSGKYSVTVFAENSAGKVNCSVTISIEGISKQYTDISLLLGKYSKRFVLRLPEIPEMHYISKHRRRGKIFYRGTSVLVYFPRSIEITVMLHFTVKTLEKSIPKFWGQHNTSRSP